MKKPQLIEFSESRGCRVGETHHRAKLSNTDVDQIFALHDAGLGYRRMAAKFDDLPGGISKETIRDVLTFWRRNVLAVGARRDRLSSP